MKRSPFDSRAAVLALGKLLEEAAPRLSKAGLRDVADLQDVDELGPAQARAIDHLYECPAATQNGTLRRRLEIDNAVLRLDAGQGGHPGFLRVNESIAAARLRHSKAGRKVPTEETPGRPQCKACGKSVAIIMLRAARRFGEVGGHLDAFARELRAQSVALAKINESIAAASAGFVENQVATINARRRADQLAWDRSEVQRERLQRAAAKSGQTATRPTLVKGEMSNEAKAFAEQLTDAQRMLGNLLDGLLEMYPLPELRPRLGARSRQPDAVRNAVVDALDTSGHGHHEIADALMMHPNGIADALASHRSTKGNRNE